MISDFIIKFDDYVLTDYFDLLEEPDRGLFPEITHDLVEMHNRPGTKISSERSGTRIINLQLYALSGNFRKTKDELADIFFSEGLHKLWFSDEPDRYWNVRLTGQSSLRRSLEYKDEAMGELNFIVPDGLAHAMETKISVFDNNVTTVINKGTHKAPIDININFKSDANSIGVVSADKIIQLGTPESIDQTEMVPSTLIMNDRMTTNSEIWQLNVGKIRWNWSLETERLSRAMGNVKWDAADSSVYPTTYGSTDNSKPSYWHGPTLTKFLTNSMENFEAKFLFTFKPTGNAKEKLACQGLFEINMVDSDGNFVMGFEIKDGNVSGDEVKYKFYIGENRIHEGTFPRKGGLYGQVVLTKIGNGFRFRIAQLNWNQSLKKNIETWSYGQIWYNEEAAMLKASQIHAFFATFGYSRPMQIKFSDTVVTQLNTIDESLIPLTFLEGDNIFVDGLSNRVYLNGIRADDYRVVGSSQFLEANKGENDFVAISDGIFEGYLEMREKFI